MVLDLRRSARFRLLTAGIALATLGAVGTVARPAAAQNAGVPETMYRDDAYLAQRVVEVTDTADVTLGVEWSPTVDGFVTHITFCLDAPVNSRIPVWATLWKADGTQLAVGGGSEGFAGYFTAPCFWHAQLSNRSTSSPASATSSRGTTRGASTRTSRTGSTTTSRTPTTAGT